MNKPSLTEWLDGEPIIVTFGNSGRFVKHTCNKEKKIVITHVCGSPVPAHETDISWLLDKQHESICRNALKMLHASLCSSFPTQTLMGQWLG